MRDRKLKDIMSMERYVPPAKTPVNESITNKIAENSPICGDIANSRRSTYTARFSTLEEAEAYKEKIYNKYHPSGYGTSLRITDLSDGIFSVTGSRSNSCD